MKLKGFYPKRKILSLPKLIRVDILNDINTYIEILKDPTNKTQNELNFLIQDSLNKNHFNSDIARRVKFYYDNSPRFYGLARTNKPNIPTRPVIVFYDTHHYNLSKFLAKPIQSILGKIYHFIKDSWHFKIKIDNNNIIMK